MLERVWRKGSPLVLSVSCFFHVWKLEAALRLQDILMLRAWSLCCQDPGGWRRLLLSFNKAVGLIEKKKKKSGGSHTHLFSGTVPKSKFNHFVTEQYSSYVPASIPLFSVYIWQRLPPGPNSHQAPLSRFSTGPWHWPQSCLQSLSPHFSKESTASV